jgi:23S rRNA (guanosine2251-2'-O)-methyltransferase
MRKIQNDELNRLSLPEFKLTQKRDVIIVLDDVRSLNNIGSIFRTADAFRCKALYLCGITAVPPHREIHKTALGAEESVEWIYFKEVSEAIALLRQNDYIIVSVEQVKDSTSLPDFYPSPQKNYAFIFGHEVYGVKQELVDQSDLVLEIPQEGTKHSLNIAVSAGIVIWDYVAKVGRQ